MKCDYSRDGEQIVCRACGHRRPWPIDRAHFPTRVCRASPVPSPKSPAPSLDCIHRGDVVRTAACKTCKNSTIEVSVYQCALFGECTKENYARNNPELAGMQVCRGCEKIERRQASGVRSQEFVGNGLRAVPPEPGAPALPSKLRRAANFAKAVGRDLANKRQRRSAELVQKIFETHCAKCPLFVPDKDSVGNGLRAVPSGTCAHPDCGCHVSPRVDELNKLHWASEKCPAGKWPIQTANLLYYICPLAHPENVWQWNVAQLRQRLHVFNGRRIVTVATRGPNEYLAIDSLEEVKRAFGADADSIEWRVIENSKLRETPAFRAMLAEVQSTDPAEATFFAHAKGVTRAWQDALRPWTEAMYSHNLDRFDEVKELLSVYPCCGIAKQYTWPQTLADDRPGGWIYAGTFFWVNHAALFSRPTWSDIPDHSHQVEGYLGHQFDARDAYCLAFDGVGSVYEAKTWVGWREKAKGSQESGVRSQESAAPVLESVVHREIRTLNLIYHVWPVASNGRWRWNVEQLLKRIGLFNGRKVVAIATGPETEAPEEVKNAFAGHGVEFIEKANCPSLREANTFVELLSRVETDDATEATFYAHCKGVSRPDNEAELHWVEAMYELCLDDPDRVRRALASKGMYGVSFELETPWIYPGTFWWFHNASLFVQPGWRTLDNPITEEGAGWAVEAFPNRFFADDCERVYPKFVYPSRDARNIYDARWWLVQPAHWEARTRREAFADFEEKSYLAKNPDVARDVLAGVWPDGLAHFRAHGYAEGRLPC